MPTSSAALPRFSNSILFSIFVYEASLDAYYIAKHYPSLFTSNHDNWSDRHSAGSSLPARGVTLLTIAPTPNTATDSCICIDVVRIDQWASNKVGAKRPLIEVRRARVCLVAAFNIYLLYFLLNLTKIIRRIKRELLNIIYKLTYYKETSTKKHLKSCFRDAPPSLDIRCWFHYPATRGDLIIEKDQRVPLNPITRKLWS